MNTQKPINTYQIWEQRLENILRDFFPDINDAIEPVTRLITKIYIINERYIAIADEHRISAADAQISRFMKNMCALRTDESKVRKEMQLDLRRLMKNIENFSRENKIKAVEHLEYSMIDAPTDTLQEMMESIYGEYQLPHIFLMSVKFAARNVKLEKDANGLKYRYIDFKSAISSVVRPLREMEMRPENDLYVKGSRGRNGLIYLPPPTRL